MYYFLQVTAWGCSHVPGNQALDSTLMSCSFGPAVAREDSLYFLAFGSFSNRMHWDSLCSLDATDRTSNQQAAWSTMLRHAIGGLHSKTLLVDAVDVCVTPHQRHDSTTSRQLSYTTVLSLQYHGRTSITARRIAAKSFVVLVEAAVGTTEEQASKQSQPRKCRRAAGGWTVPGTSTARACGPIQLCLWVRIILIELQQAACCCRCGRFWPPFSNAFWR